MAPQTSGLRTEPLARVASPIWGHGDGVLPHRFRAPLLFFLWNGTAGRSLRTVRTTTRGTVRAAGFGLARVAHIRHGRPFLQVIETRRLWPTARAMTTVHGTWSRISDGPTPWPPRSRARSPCGGLRRWPRIWPPTHSQRLVRRSSAASRGCVVALSRRPAVCSATPSQVDNSPKIFVENKLLYALRPPKEAERRTSRSSPTAT
jgi:hypothetical protein